MPYSGAGQGEGGYGQGSGGGGGYGGGPSGSSDAEAERRAEMARRAAATRRAPPAGVRGGVGGGRAVAPAQGPTGASDMDVLEAGKPSGVAKGTNALAGLLASAIGLPGAGILSNFLGRRYDDKAKAHNLDQMGQGQPYHDPETGVWTHPDTGEGAFAQVWSGLNPTNWHTGPPQAERVSYSGDSANDVSELSRLYGGAGNAAPGAGVPVAAEEGFAPTTFRRRAPIDIGPAWQGRESELQLLRGA